MTTVSEFVDQVSGLWKGSCPPLFKDLRLHVADDYVRGRISIEASYDPFDAVDSTHIWGEVPADSRRKLTKTIDQSIFRAMNGDASRMVDATIREMQKRIGADLATIGLPKRLYLTEGGELGFDAEAFFPFPIVTNADLAVSQDQRKKEKEEARRQKARSDGGFVLGPPPPPAKPAEYYKENDRYGAF